MRSHPPTLITLTKRALAGHRLVGRGERVLVAVSGGRDSMALLHVLARLQPELGHEVVAHGVDHGLREAAARELDLAEALATTLRVPFARSRVRVAAGANLQARAREARYEALSRAAAETACQVLATAHHADDRAETLLLRLLRGAGPAGLAVLPPRSMSHGPLPRVRPFYAARRRDIDAHLARHGIVFADDPSNEDPRFARTRVRGEVLPLLESMNPRIVEQLGALADRLGALRTAGHLAEPLSEPARDLGPGRADRRSDPLRPAQPWDEVTHPRPTVGASLGPTPAGAPLVPSPDRTHVPSTVPSPQAEIAPPSARWTRARRRRTAS